MHPHFIAEIHLLPSESGGRAGPLTTDEWRTVLGINNESWSARLTFSGRPAPGETFTASVQLLMSEIALPFFPVGAEFTVWEGGTKGVGRVVSVAA